MSNVKTGLIALVAISMLAGSALAQQKLYRWVDKDGKVHISDQLPPEAVSQARTEFNSKGSSTATVARALTAEERSRNDAELAAAAQVAAAAEEQRRLEAGMLVNYETEDRLLRAYNERINLSKQTAEATEISIRSQKANLASLLNDAAEAELSKRAVGAERATIIRQMHAEITHQQALQIKQQASRDSIEQEFEKVLARYRELRGTTPPLTSTAATPIAVPAPDSK